MANEKQLIDANALNRALIEEYHGMLSDETLKIYQVIRILDECPTVDAVEVVHGEWIDVRGIPSVNRKDVPVVKCSKCEIYFCDLINNHRYMYHYCPNCGAKMDGDGNG